MLPILFEVFGLQVASYGLSMVIGAVAAWILIRLLAGKKEKDIQLIFLVCICGGFLGAVLLRPLMKTPEVIINWERFRQMPHEAIFQYLFGEIVFYGGLIGGSIALLLFCRRYKVQVLPVTDVFVPALALAHGIGRIGCFFGGCCYGIPVVSSHPLSVIFPPVSMSAPAGTPLLATQLIESACLFTLAALLVMVYKKTAETGLTTCLYGVLYSIMRFTLEFYRGDMSRGLYGPFSTSQYISLVLFASSTVLLYMNSRRTRSKS